MNAVPWNHCLRTTIVYEPPTIRSQPDECAATGSGVSVRGEDKDVEELVLPMIVHGQLTQQAYPYYVRRVGSGGLFVGFLVHNVTVVQCRSVFQAKILAYLNFLHSDVERRCVSLLIQPHNCEERALEHDLMLLTLQGDGWPSQYAAVWNRDEQFPMRTISSP